MLNLFNIEWLNGNQQRAYPLTTDSSATDLTGSFVLPTSFLVGLYLPMQASVNITPGQFFISQLSNYATGFSITVSYNGSGGAVPVATAMISRASFVPYQTVPLGGVGNYANVLGAVVLGQLDDIDQQPAGQFNFDITGARLEPDCVRMVLRAVDDLVVVNGSDISQPLTGQVRLIAGANVRLTPVISAGADPTIIIDAIQGVGLTETCVCDGSPAGPILTINGVHPDPSGNLLLLGDSCLQLKPIANGIQLTDQCSAPCCGCQELEILTQSLEEFGQQAVTLENFLTSLESSVNGMQQVVLASRLNDQACNTCS